MPTEPGPEDLEKAREIVEEWLERGDGGFGYGELKRLVALALGDARAQERERCAKAICWLCRGTGDKDYSPVAKLIGGRWRHPGIHSAVKVLHATCEAQAIREGGGE